MSKTEGEQKWEAHQDGRTAAIDELRYPPTLVALPLVAIDSGVLINELQRRGFIGVNGHIVHARTMMAQEMQGVSIPESLLIEGERIRTPEVWKRVPERIRTKEAELLRIPTMVLTEIAKDEKLTIDDHLEVRCRQDDFGFEYRVLRAKL
jgi:hypothetical protein